MIMDNLERVQWELERAELESPDGALSSQMYCQLLAIYLFKNELCYAKYLWKRIPASIKNNSMVLKNIWAVAQKMWLRDWEAVHAALNAEWNASVADIMIALKKRTQERALNLIGDAYSSLDINTLAKMTGLSPEESHQIAAEKGWSVTGNIVKPHKISKAQSSPPQETITEGQLYKLTQFVSFLEN